MYWFRELLESLWWTPKGANLLKNVCFLPGERRWVWIRLASLTLRRVTDRMMISISGCQPFPMTSMLVTRPSIPGERRCWEYLASVTSATCGTRSSTRCREELGGSTCTSWCSVMLRLVAGWLRCLYQWFRRIWWSFKRRYRNTWIKIKTNCNYLYSNKVKLTIKQSDFC